MCLLSIFGEIDDRTLVRHGDSSGQSECDISQLLKPDLSVSDDVREWPDETYCCGLPAPPRRLTTRVCSAFDESGELPLKSLGLVARCC